LELLEVLELLELLEVRELLELVASKISLLVVINSSTSIENKKNVDIGVPDLLT
jgi:hypothetical protein